jgi:pimeloyl-ACP methyl ester carboxylesterase
MLLWTSGRKVYFDIVGAERAPVIYFAHSLAADSGMWAEQVPAFLAAGYRVLRGRHAGPRRQRSGARQLRHGAAGRGRG